MYSKVVQSTLILLFRPGNVRAENGLPRQNPFLPTGLSITYLNDHLARIPPGVFTLIKHLTNGQHI